VSSSARLLLAGMGVAGLVVLGARALVGPSVPRRMVPLMGGRSRAGAMARVSRFEWFISGTERIGRGVRRWAHRPPDAALDRRLGRLLVLSGALAPAGWQLAAVALLVLWVIPVVRARSQRRRQAEAIFDETPEVVELFRLAVTAGFNVRLAVDAVSRHGEGIIADRLAVARQRVDRGDRLADALVALSDLGEPVRPLLDALLSSERYGAPIAPALERVADEARVVRRRRREEAARRVPVKLLFPLVFCTLPAMGLLVVVPLLIRSFPSLAP
jgi:tight adherence protein C